MDNSWDTSDEESGPMQIDLDAKQEHSANLFDDEKDVSNKNTSDLSLDYDPSEPTEDYDPLATTESVVIEQDDNVDYDPAEPTLSDDELTQNIKDNDSEAIDQKDEESTNVDEQENSNDDGRWDSQLDQSFNDEELYRSPSEKDNTDNLNIDTDENTQNSTVLKDDEDDLNSDLPEINFDDSDFVLEKETYEDKLDRNLSEERSSNIETASKLEDKLVDTPILESSQEDVLVDLLRGESEPEPVLEESEKVVKKSKKKLGGKKIKKKGKKGKKGLQKKGNSSLSKYDVSDHRVVEINTETSNFNIDNDEFSFQAITKKRSKEIQNEMSLPETYDRDPDEQREPGEIVEHDGRKKNVKKKDKEKKRKKKNKREVATVEDCNDDDDSKFPSFLAGFFVQDENDEAIDDNRDAIEEEERHEEERFFHKAGTEKNYRKRHVSDQEESPPSVDNQRERAESIERRSDYDQRRHRKPEEKRKQSRERRHNSRDTRESRNEKEQRHGHSRDRYRERDSERERSRNERTREYDRIREREDKDRDRSRRDGDQRRRRNSRSFSRERRQNSASNERNRRSKSRERLHHHRRQRTRSQERSIERERDRDRTRRRRRDRNREQETARLWRQSKSRSRSPNRRFERASSNKENREEQYRRRRHVVEEGSGSDEREVVRRRTRRDREHERSRDRPRDHSSSSSSSSSDSRSNTHESNTYHLHMESSDEGASSDVILVEPERVIIDLDDEPDPPSRVDITHANLEDNSTTVDGESIPPPPELATNSRPSALIEINPEYSEGNDDATPTRDEPSDNVQSNGRLENISSVNSSNIPEYDYDPAHPTADEIEPPKTRYKGTEDREQVVPVPPSDPPPEEVRPSPPRHSAISEMPGCKSPVSLPSHNIQETSLSPPFMNQGMALAPISPLRARLPPSQQGLLPFPRMPTLVPGEQQQRPLISQPPPGEQVSRVSNWPNSGSEVEHHHVNQLPRFPLRPPIPGKGLLPTPDTPPLFQLSSTLVRQPFPTPVSHSTQPPPQISLSTLTSMPPPSIAPLAQLTQLLPALDNAKHGVSSSIRQGDFYSQPQTIFQPPNAGSLLMDKPSLLVNTTSSVNRTNTSRRGGDFSESTEVIDMDMSPGEDECELELPSPNSDSSDDRDRRRIDRKEKVVLNQTDKPVQPVAYLKALSKAIEKLTPKGQTQGGNVHDKGKNSSSKKKKVEVNDDDVPGSAVDLTNKEKYIKKLHLQERVIDEVKLAIKPFYSSKKITKEQYKLILRKAVPKVCHSKSGNINPQKIQQLVEAYVGKMSGAVSGKKKKGHSKKSKEVNLVAKQNGDRGKKVSR